MKIAFVGLAALLVAVSGVNAHEAKKKVSTQVGSIACNGSAAKSKKIDCNATGSISTAPIAQPSAKDPRLGYSGNPWFF